MAFRFRNSGPAEAGHYVRAERLLLPCTISCEPIAGSWQSRPTIRDAIGEAQKHRSGLSDLVSANSVGSIVAHEASVVGQLRVFFRGANRRSA